MIPGGDTTMQALAFEAWGETANAPYRPGGSRIITCRVMLATWAAMREAYPPLHRCGREYTHPDDIRKRRAFEERFEETRREHERAIDERREQERRLLVGLWPTDRYRRRYPGGAS